MNRENFRLKVIVYVMFMVLTALLGFKAFSIVVKAMAQNKANIESVIDSKLRGEF